MPKVGYRIVGTIKDVKGSCNHGHNIGDTMEINTHDTGGLCGFFYHAIFPSLMMLQFGGNFPATWVEDSDIMEIECPDRTNAVKIELRRIKE